MPPAAPLQRLRPVPHAAVLAAAADPDHRVPPGTNPRTLVVLEREKLATSRPLLGRRYAVAELVHPAVFLTPRGRAYAEAHGVLCPPHRAVLVACGAAKLPAERLGADGGAPAGQMYTGAYHRSCRAAAAALAGEHSRTWILSARHGLLSLDRRIRSYNQRLGQKGSVTASRLREQVQREGLDEAEVLVLGGGDYSRLVTTVLPDALPVLQGRGGMLSQRRYCAELVGDRSLRHAVWAEAARRTLRGVSQVPCPRCRLRHGRVDAADLLPGDAITLDGHTLLVVSSSPAGYGQVVHAAAGSPALKRLRFGARQGVDVRRPAHPRAVIGPLFCSEQGSTR